MQEALAGLAASLAVWVAASWWSVRALAPMLTDVPDWFRDQCPGEYEEAASYGLSDALVGHRRFWPAGLWLPGFVLLNLADVSLPVQLGAVATYAAWVVAGGRARAREFEARAREMGVEPGPPRPESLLYDLSVFAMELGFLASLCFLARTPFEL